MTPQVDLFGNTTEKKPEPEKKPTKGAPKDAIFFRITVMANREWAFRQVKNSIPHIWVTQDKYKMSLTGWTWKPDHVKEWLEHLKSTGAIQGYEFKTFISQNDISYSEEP